jgi:signal transduction histidine kinase
MIADPAAPSMRARWPWIALGSFVTVAVVALALVVENGESIVEQIPFVVAFAMFGLVGALILSRVRGNRVGALLLSGACVTAIGFLGGEVTTYAVRRGETDGAFVIAMAVLSNLGWLLGILPVLVLLPQLFPDGRLLSARWRPVAWLTFGLIMLLSLSALASSPTLTGSVESAEVANPLYVSAIRDIEITDVIVTVGLLTALALGVASLVMRFRRSRGAERQQIKWVAASLVFVIFSFVLSSIWELFADPTFLIDTVVSAAAFLSIPLAIGVSVLQYRLYDLDVVVRKALIAGALAVVVVLVYGGLVSILGAVASGRESSLTVFITALLLGVAFRPVTRFARGVADRIVYGRRATPYEVLTEFSERVGEAYATDDVLGRMAQILGQGVGAMGARVWLLVGRELRPAASWPIDAPTGEALRLEHDRLTGPANETAVEVRDRGELLGALSVVMPPNDPMTPAKEKLVRDLASQAGLALRNVRLVEELKASQRRIVAAQDHERRRIERNIHDGAQQQLVALAVKLRLAQTLATKDGDRAAEMLERLQEETQTALEDLRDLARGIYPPLLADKGLPAALEAQGRRSPIPVRISPDGVGRYAPEIEAAVYFSVLEGLQNVAKYAGAAGVDVRLREEDGWLSFAVVDDGAGFDPAEIGYGTGLQGIADRLSAIDGAFEIRSAVGAGTTLAGRVPVHGTGGSPRNDDDEGSYGARGGG